MNSATFRVARAAKQPVSDVIVRDLHAQLPALKQTIVIRDRAQRLAKELRS